MANDRLRGARERTESPQRRGHHLTRKELAEAVRYWLLDRGIDRGIDETYIGKLERGEVRWPNADYRAALRSVLGAAADHDLGFADTNPGGLLRPAGADGEDPVEQLRVGIDEVLSTGALAAAAIEDWEQLAVSYGFASRDHPPAELLAQLVEDLAELKKALARCRTASALRRLTRVAAQMAGLMVLTLVKLDNEPAFRRWARTARVAAAEADDRTLLSWILGQEAYGHFYAGHHQQAIAVALHAQDVGRSSRSVGVPLAAALEARAHAALGDRDRTSDALRRAEAALEELEAEAFACSALGYSEAQLRFHEGSAYTLLGDSRSAGPAHDRALELCAPWDFTDWALIRLDRASCLAADGDVSTAMAYASATFSALTGQQRAGIITNRGRELVGALPPAERPLAAMEELQGLMSTPD